MTKYYYNVEDVDTSLTHVTQLVVVGSRTLTFDFQWAIASAEQGDIIIKYLLDKATTDPLFDGTSYNRDYDWLSYYEDLVGIDLDEWLDAQTMLPLSVWDKPRTNQKLVLQRNIDEALTLVPIVLLYSETMRWQFTCTTQDGQVTTGFVEPGGWFRNQDSEFAFRIHSGRQYIGQADLNEIAIEFEVYDA